MFKRMMISLGMMACVLGAGCNAAMWDHVTSSIINTTLIGGTIAGSIALGGLDWNTITQQIQGLFGGQ